MSLLPAPCATPQLRSCTRLAVRLSSTARLGPSRICLVAATPSPVNGWRRQRRRQAVMAGRSAVDLQNPWWEKSTAPNMKSIESVEQLITELSQARDKLVVVDFYARWCGSCKALYPKLCKLAEANPECIVLKVDFDDNKKLCKALDVKVLPFFQFYRGAEGRVAAFSASVAKVQRLRDALATYSSPRCSVGNSPIVSELSSLLTTEDGQVVPGAAAQEEAAQAVPI